MAFAVFGRSRSQSHIKALNTVPMWDKKEKRNRTPDEHRQAVEDRAHQLFNMRSGIQISPEFDAPQFAKDWIGVAAHDIRCDQIKHKTKGKKGRAQWNPFAY